MQMDGMNVPVYWQQYIKNSHHKEKNFDAPPSSIWRILRSTVIYESIFNDCENIMKIKQKQKLK
jgi:hypothetical protein